MYTLFLNTLISVSVRDACYTFIFVRVACDDGLIKLWLIKPGGLTEPTNTPEAQWTGHSEKIYFIKFHPVAKDVLASSSYDMTIRIWDLQTQTEKITLLGHTDTVCVTF